MINRNILKLSFSLFIFSLLLPAGMPFGMFCSYADSSIVFIDETFNSFLRICYADGRCENVYSNKTGIIQLNDNITYIHEQSDLQNFDLTNFIYGNIIYIMVFVITVIFIISVIVFAIKKAK